MSFLSNMKLTFNFFALFINLVGKSFPERTKRLVLITSLVGSFGDAVKIDAETLHKLNKIMSLCSTESAMELPIRLSRAIWNGKTSYEIFNDKFTDSTMDGVRIKRIAEYVASTMPKWLCYGDAATIVKDIEQLLANMSSFKTA